MNSFVSNVMSVQQTAPSQNSTNTYAAVLSSTQDAYVYTYPGSHTSTHSTQSLPAILPQPDVPASA